MGCSVWSCSQIWAGFISPRPYCNAGYVRASQAAPQGTAVAASAGSDGKLAAYRETRSHPVYRYRTAVDAAVVHCRSPQRMRRGSSQLLFNGMSLAEKMCVRIPCSRDSRNRRVSARMVLGILSHQQPVSAIHARSVERRCLAKRPLPSIASDRDIGSSWNVQQRLGVALNSRRFGNPRRF